MKVRRTDSGFILVLDIGDEIIASLKKLANTERIGMASLTGIGAVSKSVLGIVVPDEKRYIKREFADSMELVALTGNIGRLDGEPFAHCHAVLTDREMRTVGGHLFQATTSFTVEIFLRVYAGEIERKSDGDSDASRIRL